MLLMLLGNAGFVTAISSMILTFVNGDKANWFVRIALIIGGVAMLWTAIYSKWLDRHMSRVIRAALQRWTNLDVRDYANLLHLGGDYAVTELQIQNDDWLAGQTLAELRLRDEGVMVLGVQTRDGKYQGVPTARTRLRPGDTALMYGRQDALNALDRRGKEFGGRMQHLEAVSEQKARERAADEEQAERDREEELKPAGDTEAGVQVGSGETAAQSPRGTSESK